jgi:hypothetical protein
MIALWLACGHDEATDTPSDTAPSTPTQTVPEVCAELGLPAVAWNEGPYETALWGVADDFTLPTRAGDWNFREQFTGCEVALFIPSERSNEDAPGGLWSQDLEELVDKLPDNTHVFWVSSQSDKKDVDADLDLIADQVADLGKKDREQWEPRMHLVTKGLDKLDGWVADYLSAPGYGFGIDRTQHIRDLGSYADGFRFNGSTGWFDPNLAHAAHDAIYFNWEAERDAAMAAQDAEVVPVYTGGVVATGWSFIPVYADATLPSAADMATFERATWDLSTTCGEGELGFCPAWDRIINVYACSEPLDDANPHADTACQPYVPEVPEIQGVCTWDGVAGVEACSEALPCPTDAYGVVGTCDGFVPAIAAIPADTIACDCERPEGGDVTANFVCNGYGTGYQDCACPCDSEAGRWITTYHREGRWETDATYTLPWFSEGGAQRFAFYSIDPYEITLDLRLIRGTSGVHPTVTHRLFSGGDFNLTYNDKYAPIEVDIPVSAARVELAVVISGHGGADPGNCAEFCSTNHHFTVNGIEHEIDFPEAGAATDCQDRVHEGVVPNQYGTWFYGRSNWCPGLDVKPIVFDVTADVVPGQTATFTYSGDYLGEPYPGGASIAMSSWLTVFE